MGCERGKGGVGEGIFTGKGQRVLGSRCKVKRKRGWRRYKVIKEAC